MSRRKSGTQGAKVKEDEYNGIMIRAIIPRRMKPAGHVA
jgi:hypothetical protein